MDPMGYTNIADRECQNSIIFLEKCFLPRKKCGRVTNIMVWKRNLLFNYSTIVIFGVNVNDLVYHVLFCMDLLHAYFEPDLKLSRSSKSWHSSLTTPSRCLH